MEAETTLVPGLDVSRETIEGLREFEAEIRKWTAKINLISRASVNNIWTRHILDSAQVLQAAPKGERWLDIGSGGGLPALPVAIIAKQKRPETKFTLIESDQRKCAFLRTVVRQQKLNAEVICARIEAVDSVDTDVVSARALADLTTLLGYCDRHLSGTGTALLQKGESWKNEEQAARSHWQFDTEILTSVTEPRAVVMKIRNIERV